MLEPVGETGVDTSTIVEIMLGEIERVGVWVADVIVKEVSVAVVSSVAGSVVVFCGLVIWVVVVPSVEIVGMVVINLVVGIKEVVPGRSVVEDVEILAVAGASVEAFCVTINLVVENVVVTVLVVDLVVVDESVFETVVVLGVDVVGL